MAAFLEMSCNCVNEGTTHWEGCWQEHGACAQERVRKLEKERIELEARILRLEKKLALARAQLRERRWDE